MNICAHTPTEYEGDYPPYLSVNYAGRLREAVEITVRGPTKPDGSSGDTATVSMSRTQFIRLVAEGARRL